MRGGSSGGCAATRTLGLYHLASVLMCCRVCSRPRHRTGCLDGEGQIRGDAPTALMYKLDNIVAASASDVHTNAVRSRQRSRAKSRKSDEVVVHFHTDAASAETVFGEVAGGVDAENDVSSRSLQLTYDWMRKDSMLYDKVAKLSSAKAEKMTS